MPEKNRHPDVIINVGQSHSTPWTPRITYSNSNILPKKKKKPTLINIIFIAEKGKIHKVRIVVLFIR